jgi:hypothetical protein
LGTLAAVENIRGVLTEDGNRDGTLVQKTSGVLRQMLAAEAGLAAYQDLFFMFAALTLFSVIPVLLTRRGKAFSPVKVPKQE